jgi:hypothetical protein
MKFSRTERDPERRLHNRVGCLALVLSAVTVTLGLSLLAGDFQSCLGIKGEGLIPTLFLWLILRWWLLRRERKANPTEPKSEAGSQRG